MFKARCSFMVLSLLLGCSSSGPSDKPSAKGDGKASAKTEAADDLKKLQGTWKVESVNTDGEDKQGADNGIGNTWRFSRNVLETRTVAIKANLIGDFKLDESKTPKQLDWGEPGTFASFQAIYRLEGDKLTVCEARQQRPSEFKTAKGDNRTLYVLKRVE